jgi:ComF family protein
MVNGWRFFSQRRPLAGRLPRNCLLCEGATAGTALCPSCRDDLPWNLHACWRCGLPLGAPDEQLCVACEQQPPLQVRTLAPLLYGFPVDHLVSGLKYHGRLAHAPLLGGLLLEHVQAAAVPVPDLLLPVPLHAQRLAERGCNQALEIARPLARHFRRPLEIRLLQRERATVAQMSLDAASRARNPQGAFRIDENRLATLGHVHSVAVIDDVMTTGATLTAIATTLQQAGIAHVEFWVVARTP